ncbi:MAG: hypothetical protein ABSG32_20315 [Terriglobia bacterium]
MRRFRDAERVAPTSALAAHSRLPKEVREHARRAYRLFGNDPHHPSLRFKKVDEEGNIYSVRIGL